MISTFLESLCSIFVDGLSQSTLLFKVTRAACFPFQISQFTPFVNKNPKFYLCCSWSISLLSFGFTSYIYIKKKKLKMELSIKRTVGESGFFKRTVDITCVTTHLHCELWMVVVFFHMDLSSHLNRSFYVSLTLLLLLLQYYQ